MGWKVIATQEGLHNQIFREIGEVFDLNTYQDGQYPHLVEYLPKKGKDGKVLEDEYTVKVTKTLGLDGKTLEPAHRDFAEDKGNQLIKKGPKKGEVMRFGWMRRVPDTIPIGFYQLDEAGNVPDLTMGFRPDVYRGSRPQFIPEDPRRAHAKIHTGYLIRQADDETEDDSAAA